MPKMPPKARALVDPAELRAKLAALAASHGPAPDRLRAETLAHLKTVVAAAHKKAEENLFAHGSGIRCATELSAFMDDLLRATHDFIVRNIYRASNPTESERISIIAVGGYGRATLAPYSDIDLLFLHPYKLTAWGESVIEYMLYLLWDLGFKVGHATRNIDQSIRLSRTDTTVRTAILEARYLWGDEKLFDELTTRFRAEIVAKTAKEYVEDKLAERDTRHDRAGSSRYLVEPNVKEGKGALRDLHTLFWIGKYIYQTNTLNDLVEKGFFTRSELSKFRKAGDFLWAVRCHLHFAAGRAEERLTFDRQPEIARRLGYADRPGQREVERFMKHYFLTAKTVGDLTRIVCAVLEERELKQLPVLTRMLDHLGLGDRETLAHGFRIEHGRLTVTGNRVFADDPVNLIRIFHVAQTRELHLHPEAVQLVTRSLKAIDRTLRANPEANALFLDILTSRARPDKALRIMNETGVLGRFVPDFGRIVCLMQFSMYHHFTVDEHLLRTIGLLSRIEHGDMGKDHPLSHKIMPGIESRRALYVAAFVHDIAKGRPEDHSVAGARIARRLGPRLGLSAAETETAAWLVRHHLLMSDIAQRRDLSDPKTIKDFADVVQSHERLELLLLLTVADIRAVGPGVWNGWKGELLRTLYYETEPVLAGGHSVQGRSERAAKAREVFMAAMADWPQGEREAHARRFGDPYWLNTEANLQLTHAAMCREAAQSHLDFHFTSQTDAFKGATQIIVFTADHPHLLERLAGACALSGANIVGAQIFTTTDGMAMDTITIARDFDDDEDEQRRAAQIGRTLERALRGELRIYREMAKQLRRKLHPGPFAVAQQVTVTNKWSDHFTAIEIAALDRTGLLYDITRALSALNLNIRSAHVVTYGERAVDVFYVRDLFGHRITNEERLKVIRERLMAALSNQTQDDQPHAPRTREAVQ
ncbi:[Protein-PII] uridylyltransferase / [Protein-PII]-UMP uridylyl-removing enzyme [hydrothermal vent metagenome]|uniref:[Protein-PII] uridylyltransferase / [Protein-PII]-UMP uridylyl-removing enzyme n=1 Tax=hydrothermal vent metagenome TaxID=652676 RepID=A0A3B0T455_9ZZZZ